MYGVAGVEHYSNLFSIKSTDVFNTFAPRAVKS